MKIDARSRTENIEQQDRAAKLVDPSNIRRFLGPIGYITPAQAKEALHANPNTLDRVAWSLNKSSSGRPGAVQPALIAGPPSGH